MYIKTHARLTVCVICFFVYLITLIGGKEKILNFVVWSKVCLYFPMFIPSSCYYNVLIWLCGSPKVLTIFTLRIPLMRLMLYESRKEKKEKTNYHFSRLTLCLLEKRLTKYEQLPWNQNSEFLTFYPIETSALMVYNKSDPSVPLIHYAGVSLDKPFCIKDK